MIHIQKNTDNFLEMPVKLLTVIGLMLTLMSCGKNESQQLEMFDQSNVVSSRSNINPLPF